MDDFYSKLLSFAIQFYLLIHYLYLPQLMFGKMIKRYKESFSFEQRCQKARELLKIEPNKVLIVLQRHPRSTLPDLANCKFLVHRIYKYWQVRSLVEKRIREQLKDDQGKHSFYLFVGGSVPWTEETMHEVYERLKDKDGSLYIVYQEQQAF